ncbi:unnamed protein product [Soboliphyme baturini]|uniref:WASH complex subunit 7 n=1 Tax=Soboliphyme baturini TaxID=241478 RepID=A0A183IHL4_9BILA|nr:unnamed protein product [Soboliphyme baturini]
MVYPLYRSVDIPKCRPIASLSLARVKFFLEKTFYNLTVVASHDWETYANLRQVANEKFGVCLLEPGLPWKTVDQSLDITEVMRNMDLFVSSYNYNLNNQVTIFCLTSCIAHLTCLFKQIFIEKNSKTKSLNVLTIDQVANSIRTHGTGIMNTTVNFVYQLLLKKFYLFSQFLFHNGIKSRLIKYPYERAERFNTGMKKLGFNANGQSYMDQFRTLITQIGNSLGYVRLVRSGGIEACFRAVQFFPDLEEIASFESMCKELQFSAETCCAAASFDALVSELVQKCSDSSEYFKLLVDVFSSEFRNERHLHLKNFYIIVPALTLDFVDYIIRCKEQLNKRSHEGGCFTDDGFAMGIAYTLKLLNQYKEFDSLHWFQSVSKKLSQEKSLIEQQCNGTLGTMDKKLSQTLSLKEKHIKRFILISYRSSDKAMDGATDWSFHCLQTVPVKMQDNSQH